MLDVSERIRDFVDGAEPPVTMSDVEDVLATRSSRQALRGRRFQLRSASTVLVATTIIAVVMIIGIITIGSSGPPKIPLSANTPIALDVPSTPKLQIKLPNAAIDRYRINWAKAPSYIPLYLGTSLIGYVTKMSVEHPRLTAAPALKQLPVSAGPTNGPSCDLVSPDSPGVVKVFNKSHVLVGWIFPTSGFVRVGDGQTCGS